MVANDCTDSFFWFVDCDCLFKDLPLSTSFSSKGVLSLFLHEMIIQPPALPATALRQCLLTFSGLMLTPLHSITRIYNTMFFRSVSPWVYHLSSRLIVYELCPPPLSNEVREPRKEQRVWQEWHLVGVKGMGQSTVFLNIKSTNQVQQSLTVSLLDAIDRQ